MLQPKAAISPPVDAPVPSGPRQLINNEAASPETFETISTTPKPVQEPSPTVQPCPVSPLLYKLRWANIGWFYHWGTKQYDFTKGRGTVDEILRSVCLEAVRTIDWSEVHGANDADWGPNGPDWDTWDQTYEPDAGIVNFYQEKDTLMAHVDRSEVLGNAAVFLIGGLTRDSEPIPILLRSGDVVIMSGPACRRAYHGVPRILEGTLPPHLKAQDLGNELQEGWQPYDEYLKTTRINVNVRQFMIESPTGVLVDLYVPRKCAATNRLITSKDHASVQIAIADVDANGRALNTSTTYALCGQVRSQGESDDSVNRLATRDGQSMVEIKRTDGPSRPVKQDAEDEKYRLLYSKSKVYVNPTAYARDNIPGFVALVKKEGVNPIYLLAWIPETLLNEKGSSEWDKFVKVEEQPNTPEEDDDDGSIGINLINGDTLPTLHFHDDESSSFTSQSPRSPQSTEPNVTSYPPPPTEGASHAGKSITSWGGEDLLTRLRNYAHLLRSTLQPTLFLVDPSRADIEAHSTQLFSDEAVDDILAQSSFANSHSPVPAHRRPRPLTGSSGSSNPYSNRSSVLHRSLGSPPSSSSTTYPSSQARQALLQSFSNITRATRHAAQNILSHPLAKPIVPHLPDPVKSLVNANGEWEWGSWVEKGGVGEFESARVYLARWARIVAEEGERARRKEAQALPQTAADMAGEDSSLGVFELLHSTANLPTPKPTRDPAHPIDEKTWASWFAKDGRPTISNEEMRKQVFRRGINQKGILRQKIWPFVLGVLDWDVTTQEREALWYTKRQKYQTTKDEWCGVPEVFDSTKVLEERHRIDVDCRRTDRNQPLFSAPAQIPTTDLDEEKNAARNYSVISPSMNDIGAQSPSNEHVDRMASILLTYNFYEKELGMSSSTAKQNFLRDQSGMKKQLSMLQQLIEIMDPELFRHLEKTDALNLFFCFRWILIAFKREFPFDDVLRLWEVLWSEHYTRSFVLFVALAVLESHRDMILRYLVEYCNELSMTIELDTTLSQAEVLYLSFSQIVADIDRRKAEQLKSPANGNNVLRNRRSTPSAQLAATNMSAVQISDDLRELLKSAV
ncbi:hypothetical protein D9619_005538 [Psilocybe cf. subviscida]|uniref:Rab-GAP TBC domain-containing protein n=1 Tax=Psilocybe cf. subviscida TaxID=2480587 RepID=A0A8H5BXF6_9AGAR|nr:hypothetical protein D9619_005538 [Psilocybe cf. subviscida]